MQYCLQNTSSPFFQWMSEEQVQNELTRLHILLEVQLHGMQIP
jgi:hypothetical protein